MECHDQLVVRIQSGPGPDVPGSQRSDLGGRDVLSEGELSLIRRASALECELEAMEARMSRGDEVNLELFGRLTDRLGRALQRIGLKRRPRDVTPSLADYLAGLQAESEPEAADEADEAANHEGEDE